MYSIGSIISGWDVGRALGSLLKSCGFFFFFFGVYRQYDRFFFFFLVGGVLSNKTYVALILKTYVAVGGVVLVHLDGLGFLFLILHLYIYIYICKLRI